MRTNDPTDITPIVPSRAMAHPSDEVRHAANSRLSTNEAAANIVRQQINQLFGDEPAPMHPKAHRGTDIPPLEPLEDTTQPVASHAPQLTSTTKKAGSWDEYHSSWQDYYQQYYQRYYMGQVEATKQKLRADAAERSTLQNQIVSQDEALDEMRSGLRNKIAHHSRKVRKSRHFMPAASAIVVMLLFLFLQYNSLIFGHVQAYMSPGNINPANIIVGPNSSSAVGPEPMLIIPKINVEVPIVFDTTPDHAAQMKAMNDGVAWFGIPGANSHPGQVGNTVLSGHSSNDILETGKYKFIFAKLDQLTQGDTFYINYESKRYTYNVTKMEVVTPDQVSKLIYPTDKPVVTLITCTPLGTSLNRLLVTAEQISPSPSEASSAPDSSQSSSSSTDIPGNTSGFIQRLFGGN